MVRLSQFLSDVSFFFLFCFQSETVSKINKILFSLQQNLGVLHPHNDRTELIMRTNFVVLVREMRSFKFHFFKIFACPDTDYGAIKR